MAQWSAISSDAATHGDSPCHDRYRYRQRRSADQSPGKSVSGLQKSSQRPTMPISGRLVSAPPVWSCR